MKKKNQLKKEQKNPESTGITCDLGHKTVITPLEENKKKL